MISARFSGQSPEKRARIAALNSGMARPDAFAAVMATGIVSVAAADHGVNFISVPLALVAAITLPVLIYLTSVAWKRDSWKLRELETAMGLFTYVAACAVLATRFAEYRVALLVFGLMALQGWISLAPAVTRAMWRLRWTGLRDRAHGGWELASVASSGLAMVCMAVDVVFLAVMFWVIGLQVYCAMTVLVLWRAVHDPRVRRDVPPDHWILMGGLAISTLAGEHLHAGLPFGPIANALRVVNVSTWVLATLWILPLAVVGWRRVRDWPAVFPLGMYSSATYAIAQETGWTGLSSMSLVFLWIALALWLLTLLSRFGRAFPVRRRKSAPESHV